VYSNKNPERRKTSILKHYRMLVETNTCQGRLLKTKNIYISTWMQEITKIQKGIIKAHGKFMQ
jgi:hypothetical protein